MSIDRAGTQGSNNPDNINIIIRPSSEAAPKGALNGASVSQQKKTSGTNSGGVGERPASGTSIHARTLSNASKDPDQYKGLLRLPLYRELGEHDLVRQEKMQEKMQGLKTLLSGTMEALDGFYHKFAFNRDGYQNMRDGYAGLVKDSADGLGITIEKAKKNAISSEKRELENNQKDRIKASILNLKRIASEMKDELGLSSEDIQSILSGEIQEEIRKLQGNGSETELPERLMLKVKVLTGLLNSVLPMGSKTLGPLGEVLNGTEKTIQSLLNKETLDAAQLEGASKNLSALSDQFTQHKADFEKLARKGKDTSQAKEVLDNMERSLRSMQEHLDLAKDYYDDLNPDPTHLESLLNKKEEAEKKYAELNASIKNLRENELELRNDPRAADKLASFILQKEEAEEELASIAENLKKEYESDLNFAKMDQASRDFLENFEKLTSLIAKNEDRLVGEQWTFAERTQQKLRALVGAVLNLKTTLGISLLGTIGTLAMGLFDTALVVAMPVAGILAALDVACTCYRKLFTGSQKEREALSNDFLILNDRVNSTIEELRSTEKAYLSDDSLSELFSSSDNQESLFVNLAPQDAARLLMHLGPTMARDILIEALPVLGEGLKGRQHAADTLRMLADLYGMDSARELVLRLSIGDAITLLSESKPQFVAELLSSLVDEGHETYAVELVQGWNKWISTHETRYGKNAFSENLTERLTEIIGSLPESIKQPILINAQKEIYSQIADLWQEDQNLALRKFKSLNIIDKFTVLKGLGPTIASEILRTLILDVKDLQVSEDFNRFHLPLELLVSLSQTEEGLPAVNATLESLGFNEATDYIMRSSLSYKEKANLISLALDTIESIEERATAVANLNDDQVATLVFKNFLKDGSKQDMAIELIERLSARILVSGFADSSMDKIQLESVLLQVSKEKQVAILAGLFNRERNLPVESMRSISFWIGLEEEDRHLLLHTASQPPFEDNSTIYRSLEGLERLCQKDKVCRQMEATESALDALQSELTLEGYKNWLELVAKDPRIEAASSQKDKNNFLAGVASSLVGLIVTNNNFGDTLKSKLNEKLSLLNFRALLRHNNIEGLDEKLEAVQNAQDNFNQEPKQMEVAIKSLISQKGISGKVAREYLPLVREIFDEVGVMGLNFKAFKESLFNQETGILRNLGEQEKRVFTELVMKEIWNQYKNKLGAE